MLSLSVVFLFIIVATAVPTMAATAGCAGGLWGCAAADMSDNCRTNKICSAEDKLVAQAILEQCKRYFSSSFWTASYLECTGTEQNLVQGKNLIDPTTGQPAYTSAPSTSKPSTPASNSTRPGGNCIDDDGRATTCPGSGASSINAEEVNQNANSIPGILPPSCHQAFPDQIPAGAANLPGNLKYLNEKKCQAYLHLKSVYVPGGCSATYDAKDGITSLNYQFAENLYNMLQAAKSAGYILKITSAYRRPEAQKCANPNGFGGDPNGSLHTKGLAADLQYPDALGTSAKGCDVGSTSPSYEWIKTNGSKFGVNLYNQNGHRTYVKGECNHVEIINPDAASGGLGPSGVGTGPIAQTPKNLPREFTNEKGERCRRLVGNVVDCGSKNSLFGGGDFGNMMQMMMGMQLGQGLGGVLGGLFGGSDSSNDSTQPTHSSTYPTTQTNETTNTGGTMQSGDAIDDLFDALATTTGTTNTTTNTTTVTASSTDVGQLEPPPPIRDENSFVNPISGAVPLTVNAHFTGGTSCSDSYDLSWGDGYRDVMPNISPSPSSACTTIAQVNDISHIYSATGTYMITLRQGINLTSVATTTVRVLGTSTHAGGDVPPAFVTGSMISASSTSALTDLLGGIGNLIAQFGEAIIGIFVH